MFLCPDASADISFTASIDVSVSLVASVHVAHLGICTAVGIASRAAALTIDAFVLVLTWIRTLSIKRESHRLGMHTPLVTLLLRDGEHPVTLQMSVITDLDQVQSILCESLDIQALKAGRRYLYSIRQDHTIRPDLQHRVRDCEFRILCRLYSSDNM